MMKASYRGTGPYKGVVKNDKGEIVAECEHWHRNRDQGTYFSGGSARACGKRLLLELDPESYKASLPTYLRRTQ